MRKKRNLALANLRVNSPEGAGVALCGKGDRARLTKWMRTFLHALREEPNIKRACSAAKVSRSRAYRRREVDAVFAAEWQNALDAAVDSLESTAFKLASAGDVNLITFLLKSHRRELYGDVSKLNIDARACGVLLLPEKEELPP
jgi:hypothetical protein